MGRNEGRIVRLIGRSPNTMGVRDRLNQTAHLRKQEHWRRKPTRRIGNLGQKDRVQVGALRVNGRGVALPSSWQREMRVSGKALSTMVCSRVITARVAVPMGVGGSDEASQQSPDGCSNEYLTHRRSFYSGLTEHPRLLRAGLPAGQSLPR